MITATSTLTMGSRFAHLYRPLIRNLLLIIAGTAVLAGAALIYFDERLIDSLSGRLINKHAEATDTRVSRLLDTASVGLRIARDQVGRPDLAAPLEQAELRERLTPFLRGYTILDSINLADTGGNEYVLIERDGEVLVRSVDADDGEARWQRWAGPELVEEWTRQPGTPPAERPWFQGAMAQEPGVHHWTAPYSFLTTKEPGLSVSTRWPGANGGREYVAAFNITLTEISEFTTGKRPSENGLTVVFDRQGETIGLPPDPRYDDRGDLLSAVLSPVTELGVPAVDAAVAEWERRGRTEGVFPYRTPEGNPWWAGLAKIQLDDEHSVWSAVLIPKSDLIGSLGYVRNLVLAGIALGGIAFAALVFGFSMRRIRRQMQAAVDQVERKLGQYHLQQKIGAGGNGAVFRAKHALLRRPTAVKLMNPEFARSEAARERFEHEVQITSGLSHPNTIAIYDYGQTPDGTLYYAMELLHGSTLEQLVRVNGPLPAGRVIHILGQIAGSLAEAHGKGLIHRDIKPSNAILCERGGLYDVVKVLDFGLVKEIAHTDGNLTHANVLVGTPLYMAPEIISSPGKASPQSDLYALGAVGYFLLTGRNVFDGESAVEICAKHLNDVPVPPSQRSGRPVPADLEAIVLACLDKNPSKRPASAEALAADLAACADAGAWGQQQASDWWRNYATSFAENASPAEATPLSNTELLIDIDQRLESAAASARRAG